MLSNVLRAAAGAVLAAGLVSVPCGPATAAPRTCDYPATTQPAAKNVGSPPTEVTDLRSYGATLDTNQGAIVFDALTDRAPCTTNSFAYLAGKKYFDGTTCHRLTTKGSYVLQCGDPSGTGSGGPGYRFRDENLAGAGYPAGTVAMANSGPDSNGSQFFLVYKDSPLPPSFTPFGRITAGMDVLGGFATTGTKDGSTDGKPRREITLRTVRTAVR